MVGLLLQLVVLEIFFCPLTSLRRRWALGVYRPQPGFGYKIDINSKAISPVASMWWGDYLFSGLALHSSCTRVCVWYLG